MNDLTILKATPSEPMALADLVSPLTLLMMALVRGPSRTLKRLRYSSRGLVAEFSQNGKTYEIELREIKPAAEQIA